MTTAVKVNMGNVLRLRGLRAALNSFPFPLRLTAIGCDRDDCRSSPSNMDNFHYAHCFCRLSKQANLQPASEQSQRIWTVVCMQTKHDFISRRYYGNIIRSCCFVPTRGSFNKVSSVWRVRWNFLSMKGISTSGNIFLVLTPMREEGERDAFVNHEI